MKFLGIQFILNVLSQYTERITIFQVYYNSELNSFRSLRDPQTERNNSSIISTVFKKCDDRVHLNLNILKFKYTVK